VADRARWAAQRIVDLDLAAAVIHGDGAVGETAPLVTAGTCVVVL
jgi:hypothetical protein